jgi:SAM-dependent methyltransferase
LTPEIATDSAAARGEACCVCGSTDAPVWFVGRDNLLGGPDLFTTLKCQACGTVRLQPRPPSGQMGQYYTAATYARAEEGDGASELARRLDTFFEHQAERATRSVAVYGSGRRMLDVGCGDGRFLVAMAFLGWDGEGIETDPVAADLARKRTGTTISETPLEESVLPAASFDLVSLLHVLEHVPDPRATIAAAYRLLKPGGTLLLALPNAQCLESTVFKENWYPLDLPRHYWGFNPASLIRLTNECGFIRPTMRYLPFFFVPQSVRYLVRSLRKKTTPTAQALLPTSPVRESKMQTLLFAALLVLSEWLGRTVRGEIMELAVQKPAGAK